MPITDKELAAYCQALYDDDKLKLYDKRGSTTGVDWAVAYPDAASTVICFEGSHDIPDWESNFEFEMIKVEAVGGVEKGFYTGLPETLIQTLASLPKERTTYVIGHSRGAAHAHIFTRLLINAGYDPAKLVRVVWGSPHPGDPELSANLAKVPCRSYRNYANALEQDFVCVVPEALPGLPYEHPGPYILINEAPPTPDPWLLLARHHFYLYERGTPANAF